MKKLLPLLTALALLCLLVSPAGAQSPRSLLSAVQAELGAKRYQAALDKSELLVRALWAKVPFHIGTALFTKGEAGGYGIFNPRGSNVFPRSGKPIYIYLEPVGYKVAQKAPGIYDFGLSMDLALTDTKGTILWGKQGFLKRSVTSRRFNREFFVTVTLTLDNVPAGDYLIYLRVKDKNSPRLTEVRLPIRFQ